MSDTTEKVNTAKPGPRSTAPSEIRYCKREGKNTEWRQYKRGQDEKGNQRFQWRCHSCLNKADSKSKIRRARAELVSQGRLSVSDVLSKRLLRQYGEGLDDAWGIWCDSTGREDTENVNPDFALAFVQARKAGMTIPQINHRVRVSAFLTPLIDNLDVQRVIKTLSDDDRYTTGKMLSAQGNGRAPYEPHEFKWQGARGVDQRVKKMAVS